MTSKPYRLASQKHERFLMRILSSEPWFELAAITFPMDNSAVFISKVDLLKVRNFFLPFPFLGTFA